MNKKIENIADEISFRLLATKKHKDYQWLYNTLESMNKKKPDLREVLEGVEEWF